MIPFHLAFPIIDIETTRRFYGELLGATVGREADRWIDFDFFGHQLSAHVSPDECSPAATNPVDGAQVPVRHFGVILEWSQWEALADRIRESGHDFLIEPGIRFKGKSGEQGTFFILDPSGNGLEFKTFKDFQTIFQQ